MQNALFDAIAKHLCSVVAQCDSTRTVFRVMQGMKVLPEALSSALLVKNPETDYLEIKNGWNLSGQTSRTFRRPVGTGVFGKVFYAKEMVVVTPREAGEYEELLLGQPYGMAVAVRVSVDSQAVGVLLIHFNEYYPLPRFQECFFHACANIIGAAMNKERLLGIVNQLRRYDEETGLLCNDFFQMKLQEEFRKAERYKFPLALSIYDIDNFKQVANLHGLATARKLRCEVADELKTILRGVDLIGCFGVDEFIVCMPHTPLEGAKIVINRFRKNISSRNFTLKEVKTSVSIGLTSTHAGEKLPEFIWRAQTGLFKAKCHPNGGMKAVP